MMTEILSLALLLPLIPDSPKAIIYAHTILIVLPVDAELVLVVASPLDHIPS